MEAYAKAKKEEKKHFCKDKYHVTYSPQPYKCNKVANKKQIQILIL